jgi:hypothetical protein
MEVYTSVEVAYTSVGAEYNFVAAEYNCFEEEYTVVEGYNFYLEQVWEYVSEVHTNAAPVV